jgi:hypothetical protein
VTNFVVLHGWKQLCCMQWTLVGEKKEIWKLLLTCGLLHEIPFHGCILIGCLGFNSFCQTLLVNVTWSKEQKGQRKDIKTIAQLPTTIKKSVNSPGVSQGVSHPINFFALSSSDP